MQFNSIRVFVRVRSLAWGLAVWGLAAGVRADDLIVGGSLIVGEDLVVGGQAILTDVDTLRLQASQIFNTNNWNVGLHNSSLGGLWNVAESQYSVVAGGQGNRAGSFDTEMGDDSGYDTVGGGQCNQAVGGSSVIAGGYWNVVRGVGGFIGGGMDNYSHGHFSAVGGGWMNYARDMCSFIGGGEMNEVNFSPNWEFGYNVIVGGLYNTIGGSNECVSIAGGGWNTTTPLSQNISIGGGYRNAASGKDGVIGGGRQNLAAGAVVVGGGIGNSASADGAVIPGGQYNLATGRNSLAAGLRAQALHGGSFVWQGAAGGNVQTPPFASTGENQFLVKAPGGVGINTNVTGGQALRVAGDAEVLGRLTAQQLQVLQTPDSPAAAVNYQTLVNQIEQAGFVRSIVDGGTKGKVGSVSRVGDKVTITFPEADSVSPMAGPVDGRLTGVADPEAEDDAVNLRTAQNLIAAALQNVGPFGDVSMGCFTERP